MRWAAIGPYTHHLVSTSSSTCRSSRPQPFPAIAGDREGWQAFLRACQELVRQRLYNETVPTGYCSTGCLGLPFVKSTGPRSTGAMGTGITAEGVSAVGVGRPTSATFHHHEIRFSM
jgi:hypothetical protein